MRFTSTQKQQQKLIFVLPQQKVIYSKLVLRISIVIQIQTIWHNQVLWNTKAFLHVSFQKFTVKQVGTFKIAKIKMRTVFYMFTIGYTINHKP